MTIVLDLYIKRLVGRLRRKWAIRRMLLSQRPGFDGTSLSPIELAIHAPNGSVLPLAVQAPQVVLGRGSHTDVNTHAVSIKLGLGATVAFLGTVMVK